ncbi:MAG: hypothetical protein LBK58_16110 [Prevotellaceae bacterium]|jgi:hypothetical protein|nr:hypothetical protein [Prevotellaceae bacterium]
MSKIPIRKKDIRTIVEQKDGQGKPVPFDAVVYSLDGRRIELQQVQCSSGFHDHGTCKIIFPNGQIRNVKESLFISVNGREAFL